MSDSLWLAKTRQKVILTTGALLAGAANFNVTVRGAIPSLSPLKLSFVRLNRKAVVHVLGKRLRKGNEREPSVLWVRSLYN
jgi:hypothetical protein